ncbi:MULTISPECIES: hypothetical protein [unclassified Leptolyngbya]|uniref:hypothetical protein n=1 Tax=unclassified Leptolyngbya TaxID=2650499 RepID=UPI001682F231|nr:MULTISPECIES: hypothetical protein [unclassified Leptolyngbya]MBD1910290.1 hypothetical protein [Leptolyngbya sp. FACHB-8]MBD2155798.1 hypothetical protein [Leptolyngbya sp. FACHB-16]
MQSGTPTHSMPLEELIEQILNSHSITRDEEHRLVSALSGSIAMDEDLQAAIQRIFYGMRHGLLNVVD